MNTEDLFKYGVTPKEGEFAGERFKVISVSESGVSVRKWGDPAGTPRMTFSEGSYKIWHGPKTPFEKGLLDAFKTEMPKFDPWEARRYELVKEMFLREWDSDVDSDVDDLVAIADEIIAALKKSPEAIE